MSKKSSSDNLLGIALSAAVGYYSVQIFQRTAPLDGTTEVIAHRGGPRYKPENTLSAFANAIALGADRLECDVQLTKDGHLIVIHDETVDRTTNGHGRVGEMTLAELRSLDAGEGEILPTFRDYIQVAKAGGVMLLPEIKSPELYKDIESKIIQELIEEDYLEQTILQSFNFASLELCRHINPNVKLGALYSLWQLDLSNPPANAEYVVPQAEMVLLYPDMIRHAHAAGRKVFTWFSDADNELVYRLLLAFGIDGIITDDPKTLREIIKA